jgi:hypothetical protein
MKTRHILTGRVNGSSSGLAKAGLATSQRVSTGVYVLRFPPGVKLIECIPALVGGAAWGLVQNDQDTDSSTRVVIANTGGTVNIDLDWRYIAVVEGTL